MNEKIKLVINMVNHVHESYHGMYWVLPDGSRYTQKLKKTFRKEKLWKFIEDHKDIFNLYSISTKFGDVYYKGKIVHNYDE